MYKQDCDTCVHYNDNRGSLVCYSCIINSSGNPDQYVKEPSIVISDNHKEILNALATLIEICEKYNNMVDGCNTMCPLRSSYNDQAAGWSFCAFEASIIPADWTLMEPADEDDFPILLETDFIEPDEEDYNDTP